MDGKTLGVDENPHANEEPKAAIQEIVWSLMREFEGQDATPDEVVVALNESLAHAGIPEQPARWTEATSIEIAGGRQVVMDTANQVDPEYVEVGDQEGTVLGAPAGIPQTEGPQPTVQERDAE